MSKLELSLLVGAESKAWLAGLESVVERLEAVAGKVVEAKLNGTKSLKEAEEDFDTDVEADEEFAPKKSTKKSAAASFDEDETEGVEAASDDEEEEFEEPTTKKAKKLTIDDVNDACKKRAEGGKRKEVLAILKKKFKTETISALKPEQYAAAIAAMGA